MEFLHHEGGGTGSYARELCLINFLFWFVTFSDSITNRDIVETHQINFAVAGWRGNLEDRSHPRLTFNWTCTRDFGRSKKMFP